MKHKREPQAPARPIDAAVRAVTALVLAIERDPGAPGVTDYRNAIRRQGLIMAAWGGSQAMQAVLTEVGRLSPARADDRQALIQQAWSGLPIWF